MTPYLLTAIKERAVPSPFMVSFHFLYNNDDGNLGVIKGGTLRQ